MTTAMRVVITVMLNFILVMVGLEVVLILIFILFENRLWDDEKC